MVVEVALLGELCAFAPGSIWLIWRVRAALPAISYGGPSVDGE